MIHHLSFRSFKVHGRESQAHLEMLLEAQARILGREEGADGQSISAITGWRMPISTTGGHRFDIEASLRGDAYNTKDGEAVGASGDSTALRGTPAC